MSVTPSRQPASAVGASIAEKVAPSHPALRAAPKSAVRSIAPPAAGMLADLNLPLVRMVKLMQADVVAPYAGLAKSLNSMLAVHNSALASPTLKALRAPALLPAVQNVNEVGALKSQFTVPKLPDLALPPVVLGVDKSVLVRMVLPVQMAVAALEAVVFPDVTVGFPQVRYEIRFRVAGMARRVVSSVEVPDAVGGGVD